MKTFPLIHNFSQGNPDGPGRGNVPAMLRRVAASIEELGIVTVQDITFETEVDQTGLWPSMTVYFRFGELGEDCTCGQCPNRQQPL